MKFDKLSDFEIAIELPDEEVTQMLGQCFAKVLQDTKVAQSIWLHGDLGAGKSTLARATLRALGVTGAIKSPTYTLVERYPLHFSTANDLEAWHLDLYRIADPAELEYLGLDSENVRVWLVEWPEKGRGVLPSPDWEITLTQSATGGRLAQIRGKSVDSVTVLTLNWEAFH